jgi:cell volume regulation protein A
VARLTGAAVDRSARDVVLDSAPLDDLDAVLLQFDVPTPAMALRTGDHGLVATARQHPRTVERRLREVGRGGRLARWHALPGDPAQGAPETPTDPVGR